MLVVQRIPDGSSTGFRPPLRGYVDFEDSPSTGFRRWLRAVATTCLKASFRTTPENSTVIDSQDARTGNTDPEKFRRAEGPAVCFFHSFDLLRHFRDGQGIDPDLPRIDGLPADFFTTT